MCGRFLDERLLVLCLVSVSSKEFPRMPLPAFLRWLFPLVEQEAATLIQEQTKTLIQEQINPTYSASSPTQEDWYWGRLATGSEEDYYWRRLSDNWYQKDVIPSTFLEILNSCYEAYNANPLAQAIIEITVSFVVGQGIKPVAKTKKVQKLIDAFWND